MIADARALLDWLDAHPDIPMPTHGMKIHHAVTEADDATELAEVTRIAEAAGVAVTDTDGSPATDKTTHHHAVYSIGTCKYQAVAVTAAVMDAWNRHMDLLGDQS
jgi:hypothetical protein